MVKKHSLLIKVCLYEFFVTFDSDGRLVERNNQPVDTIFTAFRLISDMFDKELFKESVFQ